MIRVDLRITTIQRMRRGGSLTPVLSGVLPRMDMEYTIQRAMFGSGAGTGTEARILEVATQGDLLPARSE